MAFDAMPADEFDFLMTLTPEERAQYLRNQKELRAGRAPFAPPKPRNAPQGPQQPIGDPINNAPQGPQQPITEPINMEGYSNDPGDFWARDKARGAHAQARKIAQGIADDTMDAIARENRSRVVQSREQAARNHELQMAAMAQDTLLQRLAAEQRERERDRILQKQLQTGVTNRQFIDGQWVDV